MTQPNDSHGEAAPLSPENWAHVRALVEEALTLPREARPAFLTASCGDDDALRDRVERLVAAAERAGGSWGFLAHPAGELAAPLLAAAVNPLGTADHLARLRTALADRYRIERELGAGGMATVYLAHDVRHGRQVAIKVLHPDLSAVLGAERFLSEIKTTAALQHPNILPLFDSGSADGLLFYVMPLVEGETLRARLAREKQLPVADAIRIVSEVASALDYAHRRGVIHRDIKPENILLHEGRPLVADFGIALAVQSAGAERLTQPGISLGTPQYMSPEQSLGEQAITARSDIYALGVVTYEMLTGEPPFTGATIQQILARVHTEEPRAIAAQRKHVMPHTEAAVLTALEKLPADRFESAGEFARALSDPGFRGPAPIGSSSRAPAARWRYAVLLVLAIGVLWTVWRLRVGDGADTAQRAAGTLGADAQQSKSIAVLPFENLGPADDDYFAAGMTDEITSRLGAVSGLGVVSRRAAQRYAGTDKTMPEIGRELGTNYLLTGRARWTGSGSRNVRITLELLRAQDERQLWAMTYDRVIDDIFEVQSDIAGQVIERLGVTLLEGERDRLSSEPTENHEAYTLYLKGRYFWNKRTEENIQIALDYFQQAVDLDPSYSLAWAGIADTWIARGWYSRLAPRETYPKAKHAANRALEFDSTLAEAHLSLAHIHFHYDHDWDAAEHGYRRAIALNPKHPTAHQWYGGFLSARDRHDDALQHGKTAQALDPLSLIIQTWVGLRYYFAGKHEDAIAEYLKALELDRDFAPAHWHLGWAYAQIGRFNEAVAEAERALAIDSGSLLYLTSLGHAYAKAGMRDKAHATLARLAQASATRHVSAYHVAVIHIALGDTNAGLDWLERAHDERSPWIGYLRVDPRVDPVRSHPRFESLLRKTRLLS